MRVVPLLAGGLVLLASTALAGATPLAKNGRVAFMVKDGSAELMWFESLEAVKGFMGEDYETAHVPPPARRVLSLFDERSAHFEIVERRDQSTAAR